MRPTGAGGHRLLLAMLLLMTLPLCGSALADERWGLALAAGEGADGQLHDSARMSVQRHWRSPLREGRLGTLGGYWDFGLTLWDASDLNGAATDGGARRLYALGAGPVLRWSLPAWADGRVQAFLELGVGFSLLSDDKLRSGKIRPIDLGSRWQFEDRGTVGLRIGSEGRFEIAYQRMHHSNLNLASSNIGVDSHLLLLGWRW